MDQLGAITLFNKVVETGSFSEAGRQSNLAPSSVSRRIVDLESLVGASLFHRTTRKLSLTDVGRFFHDRTKDILLDLEETRTLSAALQDKPVGHVRISMPASLEQHIVVACSLFQEQWPDVSFNLTSTDRMVDLISEGFDIAIRTGELADSTLRARKIAEVKRYLCASPQYIAKMPALSHPKDIENHQCLTLGRNPGNNIWRFGKNNKVIDVNTSGKLDANSGNILLTAARHGAGIILAPAWILGPAMAKGDLVQLLPKYTPYPTTSSLNTVHPYQRFIPPKVRMFIDFLTEHFSSDYDWSVNPADYNA